MDKEKELVAKLKDEFDIKSLLGKKGLGGVLVSASKVSEAKAFGLKTYSDTYDADVYLTDSLDEVKEASKKGKEVALMLNIVSPSDAKLVVQASKLNVSVVFVDVKDWKIIALENLIAELQKTNTRLFALAKSVDEVPTLFTVLERGVDGVLLEVKSVNDVDKATEVLSKLERVKLGRAKIIKVKDVGLGDRVCVDTTSMLDFGEGLLVGSKANFLFLVHNESVGSAFTSPRPFRVNAGSIHSYVLAPEGKTMYLSELEAGQEVLVVSKDGSARKVTVGRAKIERRPLRLIKAKVNDDEGTVLLQNAETIRLVGSNGNLIPVTEAKEGQEVLVYFSEAKARHFGIAVEEFVLEK